MTTATVTPAQDAAPAPGSDAYNAAMVAKVEGTAPAAVAAVAATRPEYVPEKFWDAKTGAVNVEAMAKSYGELERTRAPAKPAPATPKIEPAADAAKPAEVAAAADVAAADKPAQAAAITPADWTALHTEFDTDGKLADASYEKLGKLGFDKATVDTYIAGRQAQVADYHKAAHDAAGSPEKFTALVEWAKSGLNAAEIAAFNVAADSGDKAQLALAVQGLAARYTAVNGDKPDLVQGKSVGSVEGYASRAQMTSDMRDPRYSKDPAYRLSVQNKLAVTTAF